MAVMVVSNESTGDLGYLAERLRAHELGEVHACFRENPDAWPDPADFDLLITMGSLDSVTEEDSAGPREHEERLVHRAVGAAVPLLAICYGAHILSLTLNASGRRAPKPEAGFVVVDTSDPDLVPPGPWLTWHTDLLTVPAGGTVIARTPTAPQAYRYGRCLAVQFHPDLTPRELGKWIDAHGDWLQEQGIDTDSLLDDAHQREQALRERAHTLFDAFWTRIAQDVRV
ncbi:type 1 glutamine amidotransferase [Spirillospora sp. NPDC048911]|uniref:type 1 glutamine amidotransferase n=1 Tax=Spirillospora sp. NPDC048911 TaxID=3364527 RepID=UPI00371DAE16